MILDKIIFIASHFKSIELLIQILKPIELHVLELNKESSTLQENNLKFMFVKLKEINKIVEKFYFVNVETKN